MLEMYLLESNNKAYTNVAGRIKKFLFSMSGNRKQPFVFFKIKVENLCVLKMGYNIYDHKLVVKFSSLLPTFIVTQRYWCAKFLQQMALNDPLSAHLLIWSVTQNNGVLQKFWIITNYVNPCFLTIFPFCYSKLYYLTFVNIFFLYSSIF